MGFSIHRVRVSRMSHLSSTGTLFISSIKWLQKNEFLLIHYGSNYFEFLKFSRLQSTNIESCLVPYFSLWINQNLTMCFHFPQMTHLWPKYCLDIQHTIFKHLSSCCRYYWNRTDCWKLTLRREYRMGMWKWILQVQAIMWIKTIMSWLILLFLCSWGIKVSSPS